MILYEMYIGIVESIVLSIIVLFATLLFSLRTRMTLHPIDLIVAILCLSTLYWIWFGITDVSLIVAFPTILFGSVFLGRHREKVIRENFKRMADHNNRSA